MTIDQNDYKAVKEKLSSFRRGKLNQTVVRRFISKLNKYKVSLGMFKKFDMTEYKRFQKFAEKNRAGGKFNLHARLTDNPSKREVKEQEVKEQEESSRSKSKKKKKKKTRSKKKARPSQSQSQSRSEGKRRGRRRGCSSGHRYKGNCVPKKKVNHCENHQGGYNPSTGGCKTDLRAKFWRYFKKNYYNYKDKYMNTQSRKEAIKSARSKTIKKWKKHRRSKYGF